MVAIAIPRAAPEPMMSSGVQGALWGVVAVTIWGVYLAFARANVSGGVLPADLAFVRYATAGLIMLPWLLRHSPLTMVGMGWRQAGVLTLLAGPLFILAGASGFLFAPLSHGAVVQPAAITITGLVLGALVLGDRLTRARVIGAAVIVAGLALVAGPDALSGGLRALTGDALFALAGLMWAAFAVLSKRWQVSPIAATAVVSVLSAVVYVPLYVGMRGLDALLAQSPGC
jgi:drug/metabolite transporter (DMT)-like permease